MAVLLVAAIQPELLDAAERGLFQQDADVGHVNHPGSVAVDGADGSYVIAGGGENMWFTNDAFHFLWKRVSGDFALQATIQWMTQGGNAHRKACLMVRQTLDPDSPYVDVALHGDGLTSLQFRDSPGALTHEIQSSIGGPASAGIQRQGEVFFMTLPNSTMAPTQAGANPGGQSPAGPFVRLGFHDPVYVGLGVCAHDDNVLEKARFSDVRLRNEEAPPGIKPVLHCALERIPIGSKDRRVVYHTTNHIEAPNWSRDGQSFIFNSAGHIYRMPVAGGNAQEIDTTFANRCNNDHGLSPDGAQLAISDQSRTGKSMIYVLPITGGSPRQVTAQGPSYWHGWSPDGSTLAYCAERQGEFDIYTIGVNGGQEKRLTTAKGLDDGPDYSPDGKYIYFNSERTGLMQIWRMKADGSGQEQLTSDDANNWFPHPSPDGKWLVFLTYDKAITGHPANQIVRLRMMPVSGGPTQDLARFFGGQGTINVPSWSPDSKQLAFVSYELLRPQPGSSP